MAVEHSGRFYIFTQNGANDVDKKCLSNKGLTVTKLSLNIVGGTRFKFSIKTQKNVFYWHET